MILEKLWEIGHRQRFEAIAATTATGRPTYEQLVMNGMVE